jgi:7-cyano-7-deazaguanine synthase
MKAIVLLSGGLDSTVVLALALEKKRECVALSFDYGQRHLIELTYAKKIASFYGIAHRVIKIDSNAFDRSSLVKELSVPKDRDLNQIASSGIPNTYVPARNTLFLAYAAGQAEMVNAREIYAGPNLLDRNPYPDCRPGFYKAFQEVLNVATKQASDGNPPTLLTPLINMNKKAIVQESRRLQIPIHLTFSCYDPSKDGTACQRCDACQIRLDAFL